MTISTNGALLSALTLLHCFDDIKYKNWDFLLPHVSTILRCFLPRTQNKNAWHYDFGYKIQHDNIFWSNFEQIYRAQNAVSNNTALFRFTTPHHKEGFELFLDTISAMDDVWVVTAWQTIQWMRNPTDLDSILNFKPFQCDYKVRILLYNPTCSCVWKILIYKPYCWSICPFKRSFHFRTVLQGVTNQGCAICGIRVVSAICVLAKSVQISTLGLAEQE